MNIQNLEQFDSTHNQQNYMFTMEDNHNQTNIQQSNYSRTDAMNMYSQNQKKPVFYNKSTNQHIRITLNDIDKIHMKSCMFFIIVLIKNISLILDWNDNETGILFWIIPILVILSFLILALIISLFWRETIHRKLNKKVKRKKLAIRIIRYIQIFVLSYAFSTTCFIVEHEQQDKEIIFALNLFKILVNVHFEIFEILFLVGAQIAVNFFRNYDWSTFLFQIYIIDFMILIEWILRLKCGTEKDDPSATTNIDATGNKNMQFSQPQSILIKKSQANQNSNFMGDQTYEVCTNSNNCDLGRMIENNKIHINFIENNIQKNEIKNMNSTSNTKKNSLVVDEKISSNKCLINIIEDNTYQSKDLAIDHNQKGESISDVSPTDTLNLLSHKNKFTSKISTFAKSEKVVSQNPEIYIETEKIGEDAHLTQSDHAENLKGNNDNMRLSLYLAESKEHSDASTIQINTLNIKGIPIIDSVPSQLDIDGSLLMPISARSKEITPSCVSGSCGDQLLYESILMKLNEIIMLFDVNCELMTSNLDILYSVKNKSSFTAARKLLDMDYQKNVNQRSREKIDKPIAQIFDISKSKSVQANYKTVQKLRSIYAFLKNLTKKSSNTIKQPKLKESLRKLKKEANKGLISIPSLGEFNANQGCISPKGTDCLSNKNSLTGFLSRKENKQDCSLNTSKHPVSHNEDAMLKSLVTEKFEENINIQTPIDFSEQITLLKMFMINWSSAKDFNNTNSSKESADALNFLNGSHTLIFSYHTILIEISISVNSTEPMLFLIITDMKEKLSILNFQDKNRFKNELLRSISHELRTPMNYCVPTMELLGEKFLDLQDELTDERNKILAEKMYVDIVNTWNNLRHMNLIIDGIVDFSYIETTGIKISVTAVDIEEAIMNNLEIYRFLSEQKNIQIFQEIDEKLKKYDTFFWNTDQKRFNILFTMIYHNSIKFIHNDHGTITIVVDSVDFNIIRVKITDTGIGIDKLQLKGLRNSFHNRLSSFRTENSSGIGLGLKISSMLQRYLGGKGYNKLIIDSKKDGGTSISFYQKFFDENALIGKDSSSNTSLIETEYVENNNKEVESGNDKEIIKQKSNLVKEMCNADQAEIQSRTLLLKDLENEQVDNDNHSIYSIMRCGRLLSDSKISQYSSDSQGGNVIDNKKSPPKRLFSPSWSKNGSKSRKISMQEFSSLQSYRTKKNICPKPSIASQTNNNQDESNIILVHEFSSDRQGTKMAEQADLKIIEIMPIPQNAINDQLVKIQEKYDIRDDESLYNIPEDFENERINLSSKYEILLQSGISGFNVRQGSRKNSNVFEPSRRSNISCSHSNLTLRSEILLKSSKSIPRNSNHNLNNEIPGFNLFSKSLYMSTDGNKMIESSKSLIPRENSSNKIALTKSKIPSIKSNRNIPSDKLYKEMCTIKEEDLICDGESQENIKSLFISNKSKDFELKNMNSIVSSVFSNKIEYPQVNSDCNNSNNSRSKSVANKSNFFVE